MKGPQDRPVDDMIINSLTIAPITLPTRLPVTIQDVLGVGIRGEELEKKDYDHVSFWW